MKTYLIDGTNLSRGDEYDPRFPEMEHLRCLELVDRLTLLGQGRGRIAPAVVEIFFDGPPRPVGSVQDPVRLRFSGERPADELILGAARALRAQGRGVVVATEDGALRREVEEEGGRVIGRRELERLLGDP